MTGAPTRRTLLAGAAAVLALPARGQSDRWAPVIEAAEGLDQLHALVIALDGQTALERRFRGPALGQPVNVKSVSKTVVAALTGVAIDRGEIGSLDATLGELAPQLIPSGADPRVPGLTILDLVTMRAGLERTSGSNYGLWISSSNWVADALGRDFVAEPGGRMLYSTGSFHVLGAVLSEVTGLSLLDQARQRLGQPLGIEIPPWTRDPQGRYMGGNQMALTPAGMIRFGEAFRQDGTWNGTRILSAGWVEDSWEPVTNSPFSGMGYGLGWFLGQIGGHDYALARGYGGQVICVVPDLDMTLAITSDPNRPARSQGYFGDLMSLIETAVSVA
ncbi:CubicO group peptidase (beta-lactamase class C family) [Palleronia aestuarii]|uniref:CubicO group peptidase (Beta-lactamase class C family) n=1 Tax=Palleronia aestuarii TaxID=568105 RepID=A0A2W7Q4L3_9RHOB|nr:serine hydrolase [Palleronia aestuarii]PZX16629.1 CubicO group peptidase (beta-lactamase class C family) [Palleronia aestuarii]